MAKLGNRTVYLHNKPYNRIVYRHCLGSEVVKIGNVWFKVRGNVVTNEYIKYDNKLYFLSVPDPKDLQKFGLR